MNSRKSLGIAALALIAVLGASPALAQPGDPDAGGDIFDGSCSDCHSVSPRGLNKKGPTLYRIVGRRAGTSPGFKYSDQMRTSGIVWTPEQLAAYLANPKAVFPAGIMKFKGLAKPQDRANVIAYLQHPD